MSEQQRLDKFLSSQGVGSRSEVRKLIGKGKVCVNGKTVNNKEYKVDIQTDHITVDGIEIIYKKYIYLLMDKPSGVVCAVSDRTEKTVIDILPEEYRRKGLFPVGRLDKDTQGLLIITNDGDFAHRITSPKTHLYKTYHAVIDSGISQEDIQAFESGIVFKDGTKCQKAFLKPLEEGKNPLVEVRICEGMFHQVKKMLLTRGKKVLFLKRTAIGNMTLDSILNKRRFVEMNYLEIKGRIFDNLHEIHC